MDGQHWIPLNPKIQRETKVIKKSVSIQSGNYYLNKNIDYQRVKDWKKDFGFQQKIGWMKGVFMNTKSISKCVCNMKKWSLVLIQKKWRGMGT